MLCFVAGADTETDLIGEPEEGGVRGLFNSIGGVSSFAEFVAAATPIVEYGGVYRFEIEQ